MSYVCCIVDYLLLIFVVSDLLILRRLIFSYVSVTHKNVHELHFSGRNMQLHFSARKVQFVIVAFFLTAVALFSEVIET